MKKDSIPGLDGFGPSLYPAIYLGYHLIHRYCVTYALLSVLARLIWKELIDPSLFDLLPKLGGALVSSCSIGVSLHCGVIGCTIYLVLW
jgi:hypothetical protein